MSIISQKNGQKSCFQDCPALELIFLWANWEWKQIREEGTVGEWKWAGTHYFPLTSLFSVKSFFCLCPPPLLFFNWEGYISWGKKWGRGRKVELIFPGGTALSPKKARAYENHPFLCPSPYFMCISVLRGHMHAFVWSSHAVQGGQINIHIYTMAYHVLSVMSLNTKLGRDAVNRHSRARGLQQPTGDISSW